MASETGQKLCFQCEEKPRVDGDFLCRSCKEEYRKCYECGQRERNHPFKLCTVCYQHGRRRPGPGTAASFGAPTVTTGSSTTAVPVAPIPAAAVSPPVPLLSLRPSELSLLNMVNTNHSLYLAHNMKGSEAKWANPQNLS